MADHTEVELNADEEAQLREEASDIFTTLDAYGADAVSYRPFLSWIKAKAKDMGIKHIPDEMVGSQCSYMYFTPIFIGIHRNDLCLL